MRKLYFLAGLLLPLFLFSQQQAKNITYEGAKIGFLEHLPATYNTDGQMKYPLLIFLHGIGERGNGTSNLWKVKRIAVPAYIESGNPMKFYVNGKWFSFIVLSPQCPFRYTMWPTSYVDAMIDYAVKNLRVDRSRIYLAGLSMGGGGTWKYASASPANANRLAAIATSSAPQTMTNPCTIASSNLPLYAFHAKDDRTVNVAAIYNTINAILACNPAIRPIEKVWPTGGHNIFDRSFDVAHKYQTPNVYEWMLQYTRGNNDDNPRDSVQVPVSDNPTANKAPVADAGHDVVIQQFWNFNPLLSASLSKDADGWITSVRWTKISGPESCKIFFPNKLQSRVQLPAEGTYVFRVTVTDNKGASGFKQVTIRVNTPPIINVLGPQSVTLPVTWALLQAAPSLDPGGAITSFHWMQIYGPRCSIMEPYEANCHFFNLRKGTYVFRIFETDAEGGKSFKDVTLKVYPAQSEYSDDLKLAGDTSAVAAPAQVVPAASGTLHIYPDPAASTINVLINSEKMGRASANIYSLSGKLVQVVLMAKDQLRQTKTIDVSELTPGTYMLVTSIGEEIVATEQFIKL